MKKFKFIFLSAVIALLCFAAIAGAAPKSVSIADCDDTVANLSPNFYVTTSSYNPCWYPGGTDLETASLPTETFLAQFIPSSYTGNVSADIYYRTQVNPITNVDVMSATTYSLMDNYTPEGTALHEKIKSADMMIVKPSEGDAFSVDITLTTGYSSNAAFVLNSTVTLPVSLYAVTFTHTPLPKYTVTATAGEGGTITPASADVEEGASCDFVITANSGYQIDTLTVDGSAVAAVAGVASYTYTLENVTKALSIAVTFKVIPGQEEVSDVVVSGDGVTVSDEEFVTGEDAAVKSADAVTDGSAQITIVAADGTQSTGTFQKEDFICATKFNLTHTDASAAVTLAFQPAAGKTFDTTKKYYAMALNKKTNGYVLFPASVNAAGDVEVNIQPVGDYFSEGTVVLYTGTTKASGGDTPTSSGGSGGCSAGVAALALLALVPFALRRKK